MKPSEKCKAVGLKSLKQLSEITGESEQTLINWSKNKPDLFTIVLAGASASQIAAAFRQLANIGVSADTAAKNLSKAFSR